MNRKEATRQVKQSETLQSLGFTADEATALRRISMTLRRWHELECGDSNGWSVERDEETGKVEMINHSYSPPVRYLTSDRETGARKRLAKILAARNEREETGSGTRFTANFMNAYVQTDPRGAALYILRPGDVPAGESVESCYSRGICVY